MPFNLLKSYSDLLEIMSFNETQRNTSLWGVFKRDIEDNTNFTFLTKEIRPVKKEGVSSMQTLFNHLTKEEIEMLEDGVKLKRRIFEKDRSVRLHWIRYHIEQRKKDNVEIFSIVERDIVKRKDVTRTYIYDIDQEYVIVLEPQKSGLDYYLITAYHLNKGYAPKQMKNKLKNKLPEVY